jgi:hypothetical protein
MDVHLHERTIANALEAVDLARLDDQDVARPCLELLAVHYIQPTPFSDELNLVIRMAVWARTASWQPVEQEHGNANVALCGPDEMMRAAAKRQILLANAMHVVGASLGS